MKHFCSMHVGVCVGHTHGRATTSALNSHSAPSLPIALYVLNKSHLPEAAPPSPTPAPETAARLVAFTQGHLRKVGHTHTQDEELHVVLLL